METVNKNLYRHLLVIYLTFTQMSLARSFSPASHAMVMLSRGLQLVGFVA